MPYNLPQYDTRKISIGPAVIYIGTAGQTPTTDLGAVSSSEFKTTYEVNKFFQGIPSVAKAFKFKSSETILTVKGFEWDFSKLSKAMGGYLVESVEGNTNVQEYYANLEYADPISVRLSHVTPFGATLTIDLFNAYPGGIDGFQFASNVHEMSYTFYAAAATTDFAGNALPPNTPYKIKLELPTAGS